MGARDAGKRSSVHPGVFVKSAQVIESKGDELPRTAKDCAVRAPLEESSRGKKERRREQESKKVGVGQGPCHPRGVCMSIKRRELRTEAFA